MYAKSVVSMLRPNLKSLNILKKSIFFFILNCRSWGFKRLLEKANPTSIDSFMKTQILS